MLDQKYNVAEVKERAAAESGSSSRIRIDVKEEEQEEANDACSNNER